MLSVSKSSLLSLSVLNSETERVCWWGTLIRLCICTASLIRLWHVELYKCFVMTDLLIYLLIYLLNRKIFDLIWFDLSNWSIDWLTDYVGVCSERCPAGHWSSTGLQPCDRCPSGSYQNESGSTTCVVCPAHSPHTLPYSTAVSAAHCFSQCSLALSHIFIDQIESSLFPSVLWRCWLDDRKGIRPVKTGCWFVGGDDLTGTLHDL